MANQFTSVSHTGFFGRMKNSLMGVLIGLLMVPGSLILLGWNEFRTVHRSRGLAEAARVVQTIPNVNETASEMNDSLVHLSGEANTTEQLQDETFGISANALRLQRSVEMYQWVEETETRTKDKFGGGTETTKTTTYEKEWVDHYQDSNHFEHPEGHANPAPKYDNMAVDANEVAVGVYELSESLKSSISNWTDVSIDSDKFLATVPEEERTHYQINGNVIYYSAGDADPNSPQVGDLQIRFKECKPAVVSIVAQLKANQLDNFRTSNGESIQRLYMGTLSSDEIMGKLVSENNTIAWALRFAGFIVCGIGFNLILGPISAIASIIPFLGRLTGGLLFVFSMLLSVILCAITIAIAWIAVRPILGISMLIVAGVGIYFLLKLRNSAASEPAAPMATSN
ncbi:MAG: TMEM43 family protein [Pirellulaceae bacterium]